MEVQLEAPKPNLVEYSFQGKPLECIKLLNSKKSGEILFWDPCIDEGFVVEQPLTVCGSRFVLRDGSLVKQVLVQWAGRSPEDATWEYLSDFRAAYPAYDLEDKVISEEGRNDTPGSLDAGRAKRVFVAPKWQKDFVMG
ncbi:ty3-gypsy retrotransposon protein [Tanacetum coccineum]